MPSLASDSPSISVRRSTGTGTRRNAATTATGSVAATIAPKSSAGGGGRTRNTINAPPTIAAVASVPGTANPAMRHAVRRSAPRSRFHAASKIKGGRNTNSRLSPKANGTGICTIAPTATSATAAGMRARSARIAMMTAAPSSATKPPTPLATAFMRRAAAARWSRVRGSSGRPAASAPSLRD